MNRVSIYGGLGNQMFQYALCIALNKKGKKSRVTFSKFLFEYHHNGFNLGKAFKLQLPFPLNALNFLLLHGAAIYKNRFVAFFLRRIIPAYHKNNYTSYIEKQEFIYDEEIFKQQSVLLIGVWQVEAYFKEFKNKIAEEFVFKVPNDKTNTGIINKINSCNAVSIHIRRGDYLTKEYDFFGFLNYTKYYQNAINYANNNIDNPTYFVFSDDMQWVKDNLNIPDCIYVDNNKASSSYIDMYLMSICKHNLIANSTFSWWAAWLNKNENKIVVMPQKWILRDYVPTGIFPEEWVKITTD